MRALLRLEAASANKSLALAETKGDVGQAKSSDTL
jgi:hypothetical protein